MTNAELAVLCLVAEQPRHGYEIEQVIEERRMRLWTEIGFSSIYFLLKKLEREGLIEGKLEKAEQGPARKVYQPTAEGREALNAGLIEVLSVSRPQYRPLHLGIRNLSLIQRAKAIAALRNYCQSLVTRQENLQSLRESRQPLLFPAEAMFEYSLTMIKAELEWVTQFIDRLQTQSQSRQ